MCLGHKKLKNSINIVCLQLNKIAQKKYLCQRKMIEKI
jgi:hypothetical protein